MHQTADQPVDRPIIPAGDRPRAMEAYNAARVRSRYGIPRSRLAQWIGSGLSSMNLVAPGLALQVTSRLFLSPPRSPQRTAPSQARAERFSVDSGRTRLACYRWALPGRQRAPTAFMVHGWGGRALQFDAFVEPLLQAGFSVIAPDLPAHGQSTGRVTNVFEFKRAILDLGQHVGAPSVVIAHSFGCMATSLALRDGLSPQAVVFVAPMTSFQFAVDSFADQLSLSASLKARAESHFEQRFAISRAGLEHRTLAPTWALPLLVIHDRNDSVVPPSMGQALAAAWPGAELVETRGLGHRRVLDSSEVVEQALRFIGGSHGAEVGSTPAVGA